MKIRFFSLLLAAMLTVPALIGCQAGAIGQTAGAVSSAPKQTVGTAASTDASRSASPALTLEDAQSLALKHAGFTTDQVTALHAEYEIEHGIAQYDVEFHHGKWEYNYEIHADTGEILSYSKDD